MAGRNKRTARSAMRRPLVALLAVLCVVGAGLWAAVAFGASGPPTPTITANPAASPTTSTSITFKYVSSGAASFQCARDGAALAVCSNAGISYSGLAAGSHSFQVVAVDSKGRQSGAATYAWVIDTTPPTVSSISRADANPTTKASSVSWTVTFSESVVGVGKSNFSLAQSGLTGTTTVTGVSGSGSTWTVSASTGSGTPSNGSAGSLQLNLSKTSGIADLAGNALASTSNGTGAVYQIDKFTPAPVITSKPPNPNSVSTSTFVWTEQEAGDTFLCSKENGAFNIPCSSPFTYAVGTTNNGMHQFAVEAIDALGNVSAGAFYSWKVQMGSIQNFTIKGNLTGSLYPGGQAQPVAITLNNPNSVPIYVTSLTVSISGGLPSDCLATWFQINPWFQINQSNVSDKNTVTVPANGSVTLPHDNSADNDTVTAPTIQMFDSGNQDVCKNATFNLSYSGSSHS